MRNYYEIFRKDVTYDNIECHKKPGLHRFPEKYIFGKTTGKGGESNWPLPSLFRVKPNSRHGFVDERQLKTIISQQTYPQIYLLHFCSSKLVYFISSIEQGLWFVLVIYYMFCLEVIAFILKLLCCTCNSFYLYWM